MLVVDDKADHRAVARMTLRFAGYTTWEAASGEDALLTIEARRPDAVLLDIRMSGIDGHEVLSRLRDSPSTRTLPIVLCSAHVTGALDDASVEMTDPCVAFVAKRFHPDRLLEVFGELLGGRSRRGGEDR